MSGADINPPKLGLEHYLHDVGDRKFDVIVSCEVVEHFPDPWTMFRKIRSHLKSPGVFVFQTGQWDPESLGRDWWYLGPCNGHISLYSRESLDYMWRKIGSVDRRLWNGYPGLQAWLFR